MLAQPRMLPVSNMLGQQLTSVNYILDYKLYARGQAVIDLS